MNFLWLGVEPREQSIEAISEPAGKRSRQPGSCCAVSKQEFECALAIACHVEAAAACRWARRHRARRRGQPSRALRVDNSGARAVGAAIEINRWSSPGTRRTSSRSSIAIVVV